MTLAQVQILRCKSLRGVRSTPVSFLRPFLRPILRGKRFEGHAVPLEILADLAAYRELVLAIARERFLRDHPGRARVPRGFDDNFALVLKTVEAGSAAPILEREYPEDWNVSFFGHRAPLDQAPANDQFEVARDIANGMLAEVVDIQSFATEYSPRVRNLIARLGRNLRPGESVEFRLPDANSGPRISQELFSKLAAAEPVSQEQLEVQGYVEVVDVNQHRLKVRVADGLIAAPLPPAMEQRAIEGLKAHQGRAYRIKGLAHLDLSGSVVRFAELTSLEPIADTLENRIAELQGLKAGWLDGHGEALDARATTWLEDVRRASLLGSFPLLPSLFPTPEGGARAEWQIEKWSVSAEFEPASGTAYFHALNLDTDDELEDHVAGIKALVDAVAIVEERLEQD